jgi:hypothetical protein
VATDAERFPSPAISRDRDGAGNRRLGMRRGPLADLAFRPESLSGRTSEGGRVAAPSFDIMRYQKGGSMTDVLIRDVPDDVLAAIDAKAKRVGLSRSEYLRRALEREGAHDAGPVTLDQLKRVATLAKDLDDPEVMSGAWS